MDEAANDVDTAPGTDEKNPNEVLITFGARYAINSMIAILQQVVARQAARGIPDDALLGAVQAFVENKEKMTEDVVRNAMKELS